MFCFSIVRGLERWLERRPAIDPTSLHVLRPLHTIASHPHISGWSVVAAQRMLPDHRGVGVIHEETDVRELYCGCSPDTMGIFYWVAVTHNNGHSAAEIEKIKLIACSNAWECVRAPANNRKLRVYFK
jgi:hypothetical protein